MLSTKSHQAGLSVSLALISLFGVLSNLALAQSTELTLEENVEVSFRPPKSGAPGNAAGGATRSGQCPQDAHLTEPSLVPIVPGEYAGLTTAERPSLLAYVGHTSATQLFFSLKSIDGATAYQAYIPMPARDGIVNVSIPENVAPLVIGTDYQWSMALVCGEALRPSDPIWSYHIGRIQLDAEEAATLTNMSGLERAAWYGQSGVWYDAVSSLANSQMSHDSFASAWESLMLSVGLESVSTASLLP